MSFPHDDPFWTSAATFLTSHAGPADRILGPELFWRVIPAVITYGATFAPQPPGYDWMVLHKGELESIERAFLIRTAQEAVPVFANEVFVIFARADRTLPSVEDSVHVEAFRQIVDAFPPGSTATAPAGPLVIRNFSTMNTSELRDAMNEFWREGGYQYVTLRDKVYYAEVDAYVDEFIDDVSDLRVLDLCCGSGRVIPKLEKARQVIGVDLSDEAIGLANERERPLNHSFERMDAENLAFGDESFDVVLFVDAIEHVLDAEKVFQEARRVTRPGGLFFVTVANRGSLNQIMTRKMGYPEFKTNHQHIREFDMAETRRLFADAGFSIEREGGLYLFPYWGMPGIDHQVRHIIDHDAEVVELHRVLGRAVGADHAYCSVVLGRKL